MITKHLPVYQQCKYWKESTAIPGTRQRYTKRHDNDHRRSTYGRMVKTERGFAQGNTQEHKRMRMLMLATYENFPLTRLLLTQETSHLLQY
jgi:hypothetical protein